MIGKLIDDTKSRVSNKTILLATLIVGTIVSTESIRADDYYLYVNWNPGIGYTTGINGYIDNKGLIEGIPGAEYLVVTGGPSYGGDHYAYIYRVETHGRNPDVHPKNPDATGPIAPRTFTQVGDRYYLGNYNAGHENAFYINDTGIYYGADNFGITHWDFGWKNRTVICPKPPVTTQTLAYHEASSTWWAGAGNRKLYTCRYVVECGTYTAWTYQFTYPNLGGSHHDGMEVINNSLFISDMTSDIIYQYRLDSNGSVKDPPDSPYGIYRYSAGPDVEGLGYGPNHHIWISGWSSKTIYEIGGGPLGIVITPRTIVYVDDDAPNDPRPRDLTISDPLEDGSKEHPFDMIQEGIDMALEGGTVIVQEGTYYETIRFKRRNINVTSFDPDVHPCGTQTYPVIDAGNSGTVVTFNQGEDPNCSLSGFVLTRGLGRPVSCPSVAGPELRGPVIGALACIGSSPRISNCLIIGNRCANLDHVGDDFFGGVIYCENSNAVFENCTVAENYGGDYYAGLSFVDCNATVSNSIIWGNTPEQIMVESGHDPIVVYSNIKGTWPGEGNMDEEPLFAYRGYWANPVDPDLRPIQPNHPDAVWIDGDYHLMSKRGRWDPLNLIWIKDECSSLCIDTGDPVSPWECEALPNGERINMGAYGGMLQASLTPICTLEIESGNGGSVPTPGKGKHTYEYETRVPVEAFPDTCYCFAGWTGSAVDANDVNDPNSARTSVMMNADYTLIANFILDPNEYVLDISSNNATPNIKSSEKGGSVTEPGEGKKHYPCNKVVRIVAEAKICYEFIGWTGTAVDKGDVNKPDEPETEVVVTGNDTLIANFAFENLPDVNYTEGGYARVLSVEGLAQCQLLVTIGAFAEPCYEFTHWSGTAVAKGKVKENPVSSVTFVSATFVADDKYTLTAHFEPTMIEDDFELYNDIEPNEPGSNRIFDVWLDGFGDNANGALVGNLKPPYGEQTIVHGGEQSMPYSYDTNMKICEATKTVDCPCDWSEAGAGVTTLSLWFRGSPANSPEPMFVALNGDAVVYHHDPAATRIAVWTEWSIDLQSFADQGADLRNVDTVTIGFGMKNAPTAGGQGMVYFDDIRLLRPVE